MSEELINGIVSDETLGIKKKPSLLKIGFTVLVLLIAASMSYAFYMKNQAEVIPPKLDLGAPLPIATAPTQPIKPAIEPEVSNNPTQPSPAQVTSNNAVQPNTAAIPSTGSIPATVPVVNASAPIANAPVNNPVTPQNTQAVTTVNPPPTNTAPVNQAVTNSVAPVTYPLSNQGTPPVTEQALLANEAAVNPPMEKKPVNKIYKKKTALPKKKVIAAKEETPTQAIPIEEGVTREEIIVIQ